MTMYAEDLLPSVENNARSIRALEAILSRSPEAAPEGYMEALKRRNDKMRREAMRSAIAYQGDKDLVSAISEVFARKANVAIRKVFARHGY